MKSLNKIFLIQTNGFSVQKNENNSGSIYVEIQSMHGLIDWSKMKTPMQIV